MEKKINSLEGEYKKLDIVATSSEQKLDFGKADDMTQELVRLHETLRAYGYKNDRMRSVIELHNGVMGRNLYIITGSAGVGF